MKEHLPLNPQALDLDEPAGGLASYPPADRWDDWTEYDPAQWPKKVEKHYSLIPTICFNCEAACGLLAYVDKEKMQVQKFEGNPAHPGSRGRNCAKGPATINQINDPERILYPLRRTGKRGEGKWERVSWDEVLDDLAARIRLALQEGRKNEIMYHVGRPGHELIYNQRVLHSWGIDGHNSHTNVCSAGARTGYAFWHGFDRPSPDHSHARFILLLSSHLEAGHYFNPHAQRIIDGKMDGAKVCVIDTRLSNTASKADYWLSTWPGSESAVLLAMCNVLLQENLIDREFVRRWVNWEEYLREEHPAKPQTFEAFLEILKQTYARYTPEFAAQESGADARMIVEVAREAGRAGSALSTHVWRNAAAGNLGGWQVARALEFLAVLVGAVGTPGGTSPSAWNKFIPTPPMMPPAPNAWNELMWAREYPLAFFEMSFLLPHFLKEGRGKLALYFSRVYNPVWTNPDGLSWIEALTDESKVERHACLTPTWSETAWFADYVLPDGPRIRAARPDEPGNARRAMDWFSSTGAARGTREARQEIQLRLMKRIAKPDSARSGKKMNFGSNCRGASIRTDRWAFAATLSRLTGPERKLESMSIIAGFLRTAFPGLPQAAASEGLTPLDYMQKYGAFLVENNVYELHRKVLKPEEMQGSTVDPVTQVVKKNGAPIGVQIDGKPVAGFPTPSRKLEFYSKTLKDWHWPEHSIPGYIKSHVHRDNIDAANGEMLLLPTFRLPTLIHTRSGNAKWLYEISHKNPVWIHPQDASRMGIVTGDLVRVQTAIGYFVDRVWVTEGMRPGIVACSHHLGRWRLKEDFGGERWSTALVDLKKVEPGKWMMRTIHGIQPFESSDPDSSRIHWEDAGVHQNLTFPVQPDPISGQHCWHQKVTVAKAGAEDRYGDVFVDTNRAHEEYRRWLQMTRAAPGPDNLRRPLWMIRVYRPAPEAFYLP